MNYRTRVCWLVVTRGKRKDEGRGRQTVFEVTFHRLRALEGKALAPLVIGHRWSRAESGYVIRPGNPAFPQTIPLSIISPPFRFRDLPRLSSRR